jgi:hypothetical protein
MPHRGQDSRAADTYVAGSLKLVETGGVRRQISRLEDGDLDGWASGLSTRAG